MIQSMEVVFLAIEITKQVHKCHFITLLFHRFVIIS